MIDYDNPVITDNLNKEQILDLFIHNQQFAFLWHGLMTKKDQGRSMPIARQKVVLSALREYFDMACTILNGRELQLELDEEFIKA